MSSKSQSFTLVEIIAVLLVIAILAAVAAPKFVSIADEARKGVAQAGINEAKASLSVGLAKEYLSQAQAGTVSIAGGDVITAAGLIAGDNTFGDVIVNITENTTNDYTVDLVSVEVDSVAVTTAVDTWDVPSEYR
jgi:type II secretory pathway pseudopilin PulG